MSPPVDMHRGETGFFVFLPSPECSAVDIRSASGDRPGIRRCLKEWDLNAAVQPQVSPVLFVAQPLSFCPTPSVSVIILLYMKGGHFPGSQGGDPRCLCPSRAGLVAVVSRSPV